MSLVFHFYLLMILKLSRRNHIFIINLVNKLLNNGTMHKHLKQLIKLLEELYDLKMIIAVFYLLIKDIQEKILLNNYHLGLPMHCWKVVLLSVRIKLGSFLSIKYRSSNRICIKMWIILLIWHFRRQFWQQIRIKLIYRHY